MTRAQTTVLAVVVGIAIFLGVAVTLALLVFSVLSTRDMVRLDSQMRQLSSVVASLNLTLQERTTSLQERTTSLQERTTSLQESTTSLKDAASSTDQRLASLNASFTTSQLQLEDTVSFHQKLLIHGEYPKSCQDYKDGGSSESGVYTLYLWDTESPIPVYCDMESDDNAWVVIQRRTDGSEDFYRTWADYKAGFGRLQGEFWLGNDKLHRLTSAGLTRLRVDLGDWQNDTAFALYSNFSVAAEDSNYTLSVSGYSGTAGDGLFVNNGKKFTTIDRDNDDSSENCAIYYASAWWHWMCSWANLNGLYNTTATPDWKRIHWYQWKSRNSLKWTVMKIR